MPKQQAQQQPSFLQVSPFEAKPRNGTVAMFLAMLNKHKRRWLYYTQEEAGVVSARVACAEALPGWGRISWRFLRALVNIPWTSLAGAHRPCCCLPPRPMLSPSWVKFACPTLAGLDCSCPAQAGPCCACSEVPGCCCRSTPLAAKPQCLLGLMLACGWAGL